MTPIKFLLVLTCFLMACQSGRIPCPKGAKASKPKRYKSYQTLMARAPEPVTDSKEKAVKVSNTRYVKNVSVEEWDCPEPGQKKYLPRSVKNNIRRNYKRMSSEQPVTARDSIRTDGLP